MSERSNGVVEGEVIAPRSNLVGGTNMVPLDPRRQLTKPEQQIRDEARTQLAVIEGNRFKTGFASEKISQVREHSVLTFSDGAGALLEIRDQPRAAEHQAYVQQFAERQLQGLASDLDGATNLGVKQIGVELSRSLYPEAEPPEKRSLWKLMFGSDFG